MLRRLLVVGAVVTTALFTDMVVVATAVAQESRVDSIYRQGRSALNDREYERAAELFANIRRQYRGSDQAADAYYWEAFALYRLGESREALDLLEQQGDEFPNARTRGDAESLHTRICGELANRGDARCAQEVVRRGRRGEARDDATRMAALNALLNMDSDRAMPILREVVTDYENTTREMRRQAVFLIAEQGDPDEALELLLDVIDTDPDPEVRSQAVFWLSEVDDEAAVDALVDLVSSASEHDVLERAIFALSQTGSPRAMSALRDLAASEETDEDLRSDAIFWLAEEGSDNDVDMLKDLFARVTSHRLRERIIFAVSQAGGRHLDWIVELAMDNTQDAEVRKKAVFWAAEEGAIGASELAELYDGMSDVDLKEQMIFALSQLEDDPAALDKLMDIAVNDENSRLREQAIFWIGESDDDRAADFLLELIRQ